MPEITPLLRDTLDYVTDLASPYGTYGFSRKTRAEWVKQFHDRTKTGNINDVETLVVAACSLFMVPLECFVFDSNHPGVNKIRRAVCYYMVDRFRDPDAVLPYLKSFDDRDVTAAAISVTTPVEKTTIPLPEEIPRTVWSNAVRLSPGMAERQSFRFMHPEMARMAECIQKATNLSQGLMLRKHRFYAIVFARRAMIYLCKTHSETPLYKLAKNFKMSNWTAYHHVEVAHKEYISGSPEGVKLRQIEESYLAGQ